MSTNKPDSSIYTESSWLGFPPAGVIDSTLFVLANMLIWQKSICKEIVKMIVALEISAHIIANRVVTLFMWCFPISKCSHSVRERFHVIFEIHQHYPHRNGAQELNLIVFHSLWQKFSLSFFPPLFFSWPQFFCLLK